MLSMKWYKLNWSRRKWYDQKSQRAEKFLKFFCCDFVYPSNIDLVLPLPSYLVWHHPDFFKAFFLILWLQRKILIIIDIWLNLRFCFYSFFACANNSFFVDIFNSFIKRKHTKDVSFEINISALDWMWFRGYRIIINVNRFFNTISRRTKMRNLKFPL